jgi:hypothetical protein
MPVGIAVLRKVRYSSNALFAQCPVCPMPCLARTPHVTKKGYIFFKKVDLQVLKELILIWN